MKYLTPELIIDSLLEDNITRDDAVRMVKELISPNKEKCSACNGSGHYDAKGSPKCRACDGTGFEIVQDRLYEWGD